jgi:hypothetical protein
VSAPRRRTRIGSEGGIWTFQDEKTQTPRRSTAYRRSSTVWGSSAFSAQFICVLRAGETPS